MKKVIIALIILLLIISGGYYLYNDSKLNKIRKIKNMTLEVQVNNCFWMIRSSWIDWTEFIDASKGVSYCFKDKVYWQEFIIDWKSYDNFQVMWFICDEDFNKRAYIKWNFEERSAEKIDLVDVPVWHLTDYDINKARVDLFLSDSVFIDKSYMYTNIFKVWDLTNLWEIRFIGNWQGALLIRFKDKVDKNISYITLLEDDIDGLIYDNNGEVYINNQIIWKCDKSIIKYNLF